MVEMVVEMVMMAMTMMMSVMKMMLQYVDALMRTWPPPGLWLALAREPILERMLANQLSSGSSS